MTRAAAALLALLLVQTSALAAAPPAPDCGTRPAWCQAGFVCLPRACAEEAAVELRLLTAETEALRKRRIRRWGCTLGPGAGVYLQVESDAVTLDAAPLPVGLVCGWTF